jgi:hypothetical protein
MDICYVRLLSGEVRSFDIFEGYRLYQLKNDMIEQHFIDISDDNLKRIIIFDDSRENMDDMDVIKLGGNYDVFIKEKENNIYGMPIINDALKYKDSIDSFYLGVGDPNLKESFYNSTPFYFCSKRKGTTAFAKRRNELYHYDKTQ